MKRFLLVTLMCSILVGQTSCDWSWGNFAKGVAWTAAGTLAFPFFKNAGAYFSEEKQKQEEFSGNFSFDIGESASAYIGSSLAGLAALKYLHNSKAAEKFCGYDNASSFAGVLSASALLWTGTHGKSFINFLKASRSRLSVRNLFSSWNLNDFAKGACETTKGACETTKGIFSGGILNAIVSKFIGSKRSFLANMGYSFGSSSCNLMRRNATGIGALAFGRPDIARRRYSGASGECFAGGIAAGSVLSFFVACIAMDNYYIKPVVAPIQSALQKVVGNKGATGNTSRLGHLLFAN